MSIDVNAFSADLKDPRVLRVHFANNVTDDDRRALLAAINDYNERQLPGAVTNDNMAGEREDDT